MHEKSRVDDLIVEYERQVEETRHNLEILQAKLSVLRELGGADGAVKAKQTKPPKVAKADVLARASKSLTIMTAGTEGMKALGEFTRPELEVWVRNKYPQLKFTRKSLDKPIRKAILDGQAQVIMANAGSKTHAHYKWMNADLLK